MHYRIRRISMSSVNPRLVAVCGLHVCVSAMSHSLHLTPSSMSAPATKALSLTCLYLCRLGAHRPLVVYRGMSEAAARASGDYSEM